MSALLKLPDLSRLPDFVRHPLRPRYLAFLALMALAVLLGMFTPLFVQMMGEKPTKVLALPAAMVFGLMLAYDRRLTLLIIIVLRAGIEQALTVTQLNLAGIPLGVGGLLNGCVILIAAMLVIENPKAVPRRAFITWVPFLVLFIAELLPSPARGEGMRQCLQLLSYYAMFISGFYFGRTPEEFRRTIKLIVWSSAIPALYAVYDLVFNFSAGYRMRSTFGHPNVLAVYMTVVISLTFYLLQTLAKETPRWRRALLAGYLFFLIGMLLMTKTRSAWAATAVGFALYGLIFNRRYLVYMLLTGIVALFLPGVGDRLLDLTQGNEVGTYANLNSFSWRVYLWECALAWMEPLRYFTGYGLQSFKHNSLGFFPFAGGVNWLAHSVYVQLIFELGVGGLAAFLWLHWSVIKGLFPLYKVDRLAMFSLILLVCNFLICAVSDNMFDYLVYNWYWWFAVGVGSALAQTALPAVQAPDARSKVPQRRYR
jgi:hypothetical protein